MNLIIYVTDADMEAAARQLLKEVTAPGSGALPDLTWDVARLDAPASQDSWFLPNWMAEGIVRGDYRFPLTVVDARPMANGTLPTLTDLVQWSTSSCDGDVAVQTSADSAVEFPTEQRIHISLDAVDLESSRAFYEVFLGAAPVKVKPDYVKFELDDPAINLALNKAPFARSGSGHFGIQVKSSDAVRLARERFQRAGFNIQDEWDSGCCYSVQSKIWVADPDGNRWEVFVVTSTEADEGVCGEDCICHQDTFRSFVGAAARAGSAGDTFES